MKTYYDVLNVNRNCGSKEIKDAYINLSKKYHPDKNKSLSAQKKFVEINEAYSILGKSETRKRYNESLQYKKSNHFYSNAGSSNRGGAFYHYPSEYAKRNNYERHYYGRSRNSTLNIGLLLWFGFSSIFGTIMQIRAAKRRKDINSQSATVFLREARLGSHKFGKQETMDMIFNGPFKNVSFEKTLKELEKSKKEEK